MKLLQFKKIALVLGQSLHQIQEESPDFIPRGGSTSEALIGTGELCEHISVWSHIYKFHNTSAIKSAVDDPRRSWAFMNQCSPAELTQLQAHMNVQTGWCISIGRWCSMWHREPTPPWKQHKEMVLALEWTYAVFQPTFLKMQHFQK